MCGRGCGLAAFGMNLDIPRGNDKKITRPTRLSLKTAVSPKKESVLFSNY